MVSLASRELIREQIIGFAGFVEWIPSSPDLTPMEFILRGYLKQQVYVTPSLTLQDLQRLNYERLVIIYII